MWERACESDAKKRCPFSVSSFDTASTAVFVLWTYRADISRGILFETYSRDVCMSREMEAHCYINEVYIVAQYYSVPVLSYCR